MNALSCSIAERFGLSHPLTLKVLKKINSILTKTKILKNTNSDFLRDGSQGVTP
jgi:hypothetical protein